MVLGDSLSAAYGISVDQGWVRQLQSRLRAEGAPHEVVNASVSGETTAGGRARLAGLIERHRPAIVLVELGGNDGLRGLPLAEIRGNLAQIIEVSQAAGAKVLLLPMRIPPNYGLAYVRGFEEIYAELPEEYALPEAQFILDGVAERPFMMQEDRIHPRAEAQGLMLDNIWPALSALLAEAS